MRETTPSIARVRHVPDRILGLAGGCRCGEECACAVDDALWAELPDYSNRLFRSLAKKCDEPCGRGFDERSASPAPDHAKRGRGRQTGCVSCHRQWCTYPAGARPSCCVVTGGRRTARPGRPDAVVPTSHLSCLPAWPSDPPTLQLLASRSPLSPMLGLTKVS